jgi:hypothetical protein
VKSEADASTKAYKIPSSVLASSRLSPDNINPRLFKITEDYVQTRNIINQLVPQRKGHTLVARVSPVVVKR